MDALSFPKVSELMTPRERAKLVISLELKGLGESDLNSDDPISTEGQIKQVVSGSPSSQAQEYNFYINLNDYVKRRVLILLELGVDQLKLLDARVGLIRYLLTISPSVLDALQILKRQPEIVEHDGVDASFLNKEREMAVAHLESLLPVKCIEDTRDGFINVQLATPAFEKALSYFVENFGKTVNDVYSYIAIIEKIEQDHFDGMEIVSRDPRHPMGVISRTLTAIEDLIKTHNRTLQEVIKNFNLFGMGLIKYRSNQLDEYLLKDDHQIDSVWVNKKVEDAVEEAKG
jgi:hypothetical protein